MTETTPSAVRRLDNPAAAALADLAGMYDDLGTVLRCCERLLAELARGRSGNRSTVDPATAIPPAAAGERAAGGGVAGPGTGVAGVPGADDLVVEALWTTALLSYARCFAPGARGVGLTVADVEATGLAGDLTGWHEILLRLRDHYADAAVNPRERFSVGASQDDAGAPAGLAVTSITQPLVDEVTVRQTGALAYALSRAVDERMTAQQERVFTALRSASPADLARLPLVEVG